MKFNLKHILDEAGLDKKAVATLLYPKVKYPLSAINRVLNNESQLKASQLSKLSMYIGCSVGSMYSGKWSSEIKEGDHRIETSDYIAFLNLVSFKTRLLHKHSMFHTELVYEERNLTLDKYLADIDLTLIKAN